MPGNQPASDTGRAQGVRRDTSRLRGREGKPDTGRVKLDEHLRFRVAVFAPRLELNGLTVYTRTLLRVLRERGNHVMLISPAGPLSETLNDSHDGGFDLPENARLGFFGWRRLREALAEFEPDLLHALCPDPALPAVRVANLLELPLAVSVHGVKPEELPQAEDKHYDAYLASDQSVRERLLNDCRLERDRTTLISDCAFPETAPDEKGILSQRRRQVVGWVGPLTEGCGYHSFIEAAIKVQARGVDSMFSILGSGPAAPRVRDEVEARGMLPRIVVVQGLYDYGRIWDPFDIAIIDTRQPASALMVLNAMANGRPVIATEGGAIFDLIEDGVDGMIVPRDDADALAERILMLVQNPGERLRMAKAAFGKVEEEYRPVDMAQALEAVYAALLADEPLPKPFEARARRAARSSA
ncbi:MAG: glycosyltransferase family 4 protein [Planctomycetes bacterium]|nr:glycosyltransferase family 4 protein [Planctomycetota bacterium]MCB9935003.1 glycosyltransferase family 4 protein [Planctomycetota bacterium]